MSSKKRFLNKIIQNAVFKTRSPKKKNLVRKANDPLNVKMRT